MASKRELEERFNSIKKIKQIVRAMELIARNRLRRVREKALLSRPYSEKITGMLRSVSGRAVGLSHPLLEKRENAKFVCLICFNSDKGLCGGFNNIVLHKCERYISLKKDEEVKIISVGKKGTVYFNRKGHKVIAAYEGLENNRELLIAEDIKGKIVDLYNKGEISEVNIIYNVYKEHLVGKAAIKKILPLEVEKSKAGLTEHLYEPSCGLLLDELIPQYLVNQIYQAGLESRAQEEMARMVAMKQATDSSDEMIVALELQYNKLRQAEITREIIEVISAS